MIAIELAYWQETIIKLAVVLVGALTMTAVAVYMYLFKFVSFMQSRLGPMEAGPYGSLQLVAEVGKWLQKEDVVPDNADKTLFKMAPFMVLISALLLFVVVPAGPNAILENLSTGIFFVLAVSSLSTVGVLIAGWASSNKYALTGALRAAAQLIAYELPMVLAVVGVVIAAGTLNMQDIVAMQASGEVFGFGAIGHPFVLTQFLGFLIFMIAAQAELAQTPFDMPIAESEGRRWAHGRVHGHPLPIVLPLGVCRCLSDFLRLQQPSFSGDGSSHILGESQLMQCTSSGRSFSLSKYWRSQALFSGCAFLSPVSEKTSFRSSLG